MMINKTELYVRFPNAPNRSVKCGSLAGRESIRDSANGYCLSGKLDDGIVCKITDTIWLILIRFVIVLLSSIDKSLIISFQRQQINRIYTMIDRLLKQWTIQCNQWCIGCQIGLYHLLIIILFQFYVSKWCINLYFSFIVILLWSVIQSTVGQHVPSCRTIWHLDVSVSISVIGLTGGHTRIVHRTTPLRQIHFKHGCSVRTFSSSSYRCLL